MINFKKKKNEEITRKTNLSPNSKTVEDIDHNHIKHQTTKEEEEEEENLESHFSLQRVIDVTPI